jgi:hypothetical protein
MISGTCLLVLENIGGSAWFLTCIKEIVNSVLV